MRKTNIRAKILLFILILAISCGIYLLYCTYHIEVSKYHIDTDFDSVIRVAQLTDLHGLEYGHENSRIIQIVNEQHPDLIFFTGDMIDENGSDLEVLLNLIDDLIQIAPVYCSMGNDESHWDETNVSNIKEELENAGAIVLDNSYIDVTVNNVDVRIGGYFGYYGCPHMKNITEEEQSKETQFFKSFEETDKYKMLLCHIPTAWLDWNYIDKYPVNLIFCGHYHGGIIRFPGGKGLFAPYVGWFPTFTKGMFSGTKGVCILSSGFATKHHIPRLNNPPEIVIADIGRRING